MSDLLAIGLSSWIVQDGNYGDFKTGDRAAFALEFYAERPFEVVDAAHAARSMRHEGAARYEVTGEVIHSSDEWWVIDAGILLFREEPLPEKAVRGAWLTGHVYVGVDPFFYFERLAHQEGAPALIYDWVIDAIEMQTAPFIDVGPRLRARDPSKLGWRRILETQAWTDDGGHAEYNLLCSRQSGVPRHAKRR